MDDETVVTEVQVKGRPDSELADRVRAEETCPFVPFTRDGAARTSRSSSSHSPLVLSLEPNSIDGSDFWQDRDCHLPTHSLHSR